MSKKLKVKSTVYPDGKKKEWYGQEDNPKLLTNVFDKL
jgi:hypothetical protein